MLEMLKWCEGLVGRIFKYAFILGMTIIIGFVLIIGLLIALLIF